MNIKQVIELVEKWIADPESVSRKELKVAYAVAYDAAYDAWYGDAALLNASAAALNGDIDDAKYWVAEYHGITEDNV